jgi:hypothetical protein
MCGIGSFSASANQVRDFNRCVLLYSTRAYLRENRCSNSGRPSRLQAAYRSIKSRFVPRAATAASSCRQCPGPAGQVWDGRNSPLVERAEKLQRLVRNYFRVPLRILVGAVTHALAQPAIADRRVPRPGRRERRIRAPRTSRTSEIAGALCAVRCESHLPRRSCGAIGRRPHRRIRGRAKSCSPDTRQGRIRSDRCPKIEAASHWEPSIEV